MGNSSSPKRIERGFSEDHRGSIEYFNDLDLSKYKRFYIVNNPVQGTVRAWHGHQKEGKLIKVLEEFDLDEYLKKNKGKGRMINLNITKVGE